MSITFSTFTFTEHVYDTLLRRNAKIYNCAIVIARGEVLGVIPKSYLPNYREFYEKRHFAHGRNCQDLWIAVAGEEVPFGTDIVFAAGNMILTHIIGPTRKGNVKGTVYESGMNPE